MGHERSLPLPRLNMIPLAGALLVSPALAEPPLQRHSVEISVVAEGALAEGCQLVAEAMRGQLRPRFRVSAGSGENVQHRLRVTCEKRMVTAAWSSAFELVAAKELPGDPILSSHTARYSKSEKLAQAYSSVASELLREVLSKLPWRGEVIGLSTGPEGGGSRLAHVSLGYFENGDIVRCSSIELGTILQDGGRAQFNRVGTGLIKNADEYRSDADVTISSGTPSEATIVIRMADVKTLGEEERRGALACKSNVAEDLVRPGSGRGAKSQATGPIDSMESGLVRQFGGFSYASMRAGGAIASTKFLSVHANNYLELGRYFLIDAHLMRSLLASKPTGTGLTASEQTYAEAFFAARLPGDFLSRQAGAFSLVGGGGISADKENVPYVTQTGRVDAKGAPELRSGIRIFQLRLASLLALQADWENYWTRLKAAYGPGGSKGGALLTLGFDANLRLTQTWFIGLGCGYQDLGATPAGEPRVSLYHAGLHLGIALHSPDRFR